MKEDISLCERILFWTEITTKTILVASLVLVFGVLFLALSSPDVFADDRSPVAETVAPVVNEERLTETKTPIDRQTVSEHSVEATREGTWANALVSGIGALALVLCAFFGLVFLTRILVPKRRRKLSHLLDVVDSCFVDSKNELLTLRWGGKLILVARNSGNWTPISEVSNPEDVNRCLEGCVSDNSVEDETVRTGFFKRLSVKLRVNDESREH